MRELFPVFEIGEEASLTREIVKLLPPGVDTGLADAGGEPRAERAFEAIDGTGGERIGDQKRRKSGETVGSEKSSQGQSQQHLNAERGREGNPNSERNTTCNARRAVALKQNQP